MRKIASFWTGRPLGWLQKTCLSSFVLHGHEVTLYAGPHTQVPEGVTLVDPREIWDPAPQIWQRWPPVLLSDVFRLKLLARRDVIWVDCDAFATREFDFKTAHVFGRLNNGLATGVLGLPCQSRILEEMLSFAFEPGGKIAWLSPARNAAASVFADAEFERRLLGFFSVKPGFLGPKAFQHFATANGVAKHALGERVLYPVKPKNAAALFAAGSVRLAQGPRIKSVHFYGRRVSEDTNGLDPQTLPADSFARFAYDRTRHLWEHNK